VIGGNAVLTWDAPNWQLQAASLLVGPYADVPNASSPCTNAITGAAAFFRLQSP